MCTENAMTGQDRSWWLHWRLDQTLITSAQGSLCTRERRKVLKGYHQTSEGIARNKSPATRVILHRAKSFVRLSAIAAKKADHLLRKMYEINGQATKCVESGTRKSNEVRE